MACPGSFLSCPGENYPNPKFGQDLDPDKPGCTTSCREDETNPAFSCTFFGFVSLTFATDPRVVESIIGSALG